MRAPLSISPYGMAMRGISQMDTGAAPHLYAHTCLVAVGHQMTRTGDSLVNGKLKAGLIGGGALVLGIGIGGVSGNGTAPVSATVANTVTQTVAGPTVTETVSAPAVTQTVAV